MSKLLFLIVCSLVLLWGSISFPDLPGMLIMVAIVFFICVVIKRIIVGAKEAKKIAHMDISEQYIIEEYEVLDEKTQKYASTQVSNGIYSGSVSSSTQFHSDQSIWLKNLDSGKEQKAQFNSFNIDVRAGHRVLCVWSKEEKKLIRIINLRTGASSYCGEKTTEELEQGTKFFSAFSLAIVPAIPFLSCFHAVYVLLTYIFFNAHMGSSVRKHGFMLLIVDGLLFFWAMTILEKIRVRPSDWMPYMGVGIFAFTNIYMKRLDAECKETVAHNKVLDEYLRNYISLI